MPRPWVNGAGGDYTIMARATDINGRRQPDTARWNAWDTAITAFKNTLSRSVSIYQAANRICS
jgi:hypothetical protein